MYKYILDHIYTGPVRYQSACLLDFRGKGVEAERLKGRVWTSRLMSSPGRCGFETAAIRGGRRVRRLAHPVRKDVRGGKCSAVLS